MLKFTVTVTDRLPGLVFEQTENEYRNVSLAKARRICRRAARRGFNRFGGEIVTSNWGARGGDFPRTYTDAVIRLA